MSKIEQKKKTNKLNHFISASDTHLYKNSLRDTRDTYYLDYTFLSHRNSLSSAGVRDCLQQKDYLFDLRKTLELNLEILKNTFEIIPESDIKNETLQVFTNFLARYNKKKELHRLLTEQKSKILIEKQIVEELKRKMEENFDCYNEKIKDNENNMDSKEEHFQIMQKKLKEVEIYVHRNSNIQRTHLAQKYLNFKMNDFLQYNINLKKRQFLLSKEITRIKDNMLNVKQENLGIIEETNEMNTETKKEEENLSKNKEISEYIDKFKKQIKIVQMRMRLLKNYSDNLSKELKSLKLDTKSLFTEEGNPEKENENNTSNIKFNRHKSTGEQQDKSLLPLDITRKINNLMDFSIVLNKKTNDDTKVDLEKTGGFGPGGLGNVTNINMWDISCINKK